MACPFSPAARSASTPTKSHPESGGFSFNVAAPRSGATRGTRPSLSTPAGPSFPASLTATNADRGASGAATLTLRGGSTMKKAIDLETQVHLVGTADATRQALLDAFAQANPDMKLTIKSLTAADGQSYATAKLYIEGEQDPAANFAALSSAALRKAIAAMDPRMATRSFRKRTLQTTTPAWCSLPAIPRGRRLRPQRRLTPRRLPPRPRRPLPEHPRRPQPRRPPRPRHLRGAPSAGGTPGRRPPRLPRQRRSRRNPRPAQNGPPAAAPPQAQPPTPPPAPPAEAPAAGSGARPAGTDLPPAPAVSAAPQPAKPAKPAAPHDAHAEAPTPRRTRRARRAAAPRGTSAPGPRSVTKRRAQQI